MRAMNKEEPLPENVTTDVPVRTAYSGTGHSKPSGATIDEPSPDREREPKSCKKKAQEYKGAELLTICSAGKAASKKKLLSIIGSLAKSAIRHFTIVDIWTKRGIRAAADRYQDQGLSRT